MIIRGRENRARTAPAVSDKEACGAPTATTNGSCRTAFGLCPECGRCYANCSHRTEDRKAAQRKGGATRARQLRGPDATAAPADAPTSPGV